MLNIEDYFKATIIFINSLTIKIDEIRKQYDYYTYVSNNQRPPEIHLSKYYQNMIGNKINLDNDVYISVPNEINPVLFNKQLLLDKPYMKKELLKFDKTFNKLINDNPGMSDYIRGVLNDFSLESILASENYSILSYKSGYLQDNELSIISKLEEYISNFMAAYHNPKYMVDELYLPALLSNLYSGLVLYTISLKFNNVLTNKVDEFHLGNKLLSYKHIYNNTTVFDYPTNIWLYGNIDRLKHNIGKNKTLNEILVSVLDTNIYGVGAMEMNSNKPYLIDGAYSNISKGFYEKDVDFVVKRANNTVFNILNVKYDLETIQNLFFKNDLTINDKYVDNKKYNRVLSDSIINNSKTKMLLLDQPEKIRVAETNNIVRGISNLIYLIRSKRINYVVTLYSMTSLKIYKVNPEALEKLLVYIIYKLKNITTENFTIGTSGIYIGNPDKDTILANTWYKEKLSNIYDYLISDVNLSINITDDDTLKKYMEAIRGIEIKAWYLLSNITDLTAKNDIRKIVNYLLIQKEYTYTKTDLENNIKDNDLGSFTIDRLLQHTLERLLLNTTGLITNYLEEVIARFTKVINFFNDTTSYTVNLLMDINFKDTFINNHTLNNVSLSYKSYLEVKQAYYTLLEEADYYITSAGFKDEYLDVNKEDFIVDTIKVDKSPIYVEYNDIITGIPILGNNLQYQPLYRPNLISTDYTNDDVYVGKFDNKLLNNKIEEIKTYIPFADSINTESLGAVLPYKAYGYNYGTRGISYDDGVEVADDLMITNYNDKVTNSSRINDDSVMIDNGDISYFTLLANLPAYRNMYKTNVKSEYMKNDILTSNSNEKHLVNSNIEYLKTFITDVESINNTPLAVIMPQIAYGENVRTKSFRSTSAGQNALYANERDKNLMTTTPNYNTRTYINKDDIETYAPDSYNKHLLPTYTTDSNTTEALNSDDVSIELVSDNISNKTLKNDGFIGNVEDIEVDLLYTIK